MAIRQSAIATGQVQARQAFTSGVITSCLIAFTIPVGMTVATTDIIELAVLPAGHSIVDAKLIPTGDFGADVTADVGIMSGTVGDAVSVRTSGDELFDGAALTAMLRMPTAEAIELPASNANRSIGVKFSAAITGAGQVIALQVLYTQ